jgi:hypothetical protein
VHWDPYLRSPVGPTSIGAPCYYMYVVYSMFLMFKHWFCWKYQYNKYMFYFIDHLHLFVVVWVEKRLVCIYMNGIMQIKYSTMHRSSPKYTRYHHKAYILSLKQQNKKNKMSDELEHALRPNSQISQYIIPTKVSTIQPRYDILYIYKSCPVDRQ